VSAPVAIITSSALKHNMREVYFHEDDYCQLELLPEANWDFCAKQMHEIEKFSEAHRAEVGWTEMFMRSENPKQLTELEIERSALVSSVREILPPFDRVLTGYGSYSEECQHTIALGPHSSLVLFAEIGARDIVKAVWFTLDLKSNEDVAIAVRSCVALSRWQVILADWGWCRAYRVSDTESLRGYFDRRAEVFGKSGA
jgi:hypothetical protein